MAWAGAAGARTAPPHPYLQLFGKDSLAIWRVLNLKDKPHHCGIAASGLFPFVGAIVSSSNSSAFPLPLVALATSAFAIGTTEFVIMGLLPEVAADLHVSIPGAGLLITAYALGVAVGAPILAALTAKMPRKTALLALMGIFILGNLLCAVSPSYAVLMAARVVTSFAHGSFFGIGAVVAAGLVPLEKRASAIALMFTGLTLANVLGVPFGTALGQWLGWRATFWVVTLLGVAAVIAVARLVPAARDAAPIDMRREVRVLGEPQVLIALAMTVLGFGGVFVAFSYIAPLLTQVTGFSSGAVSLILFLLGIGLTVGNTLGGKLADKRLIPALLGILAALALALIALGLVSHDKVATVIVIFLWGIAAFATVPGLQMRVVEKAKDAPNLASTLNIGAFNLGNAIGAWLGGAVIESHYGLAAVPYAGAAMAAAGLLLTAFSGWLDVRERRRVRQAVGAAAANC
jgi:DHA1 family inner membrane transport protein